MGGHRSWLTTVQSQKEWLDIWRVVGGLADASDALVAMGVDKAAEFVRDRLDGYIPNIYELGYALSVTSDDGPFPHGSVVLAWSSTGDRSIRMLPYYLRQQTEYLGTFLGKYPAFNSEKEASRYGEIISPIPTPMQVGVEDRNTLCAAARSSFPFFAGLPEVFEDSYGPRSERSFLDTMYLKLFDDPSALAKAKRTVFMSHSSEDKAFVNRLASALQEYGIRSWVDEAEIKVGDSLIWKISEAIEECDFLVAVVSKTSVESSWVKKELEMAMTEELSGNRYKVLPLNVDGTKAPLFLRGKLYADFSEDSKWEQSLRRLVETIHPGSTFPNSIEDAGFSVSRGGLTDLVVSDPRRDSSVGKSGDQDKG